MAKHRRAPRRPPVPWRSSSGRLEPQTPAERAAAGVARGGRGEHLAPHATPVAVRDGVAIVQCSSGMWAEELGLLQGEMLARLAAELGRGRGARAAVPRDPHAGMGPERSEKWAFAGTFELCTPICTGPSVL
jgi:hypothetical protein